MHGLRPNNYYSMTQLEEIFNRGLRGSGIKRILDDRENLVAMVVFAKEDGPYTDTIEGENFKYWGQTRSNLKPPYEHAFNTGIITASEEGLPIHFFHQENEETEWLYYGEVTLIDYEVKEDNNEEENYLFTLRPTELVTDTGHKKAKKEIKVAAQEEPQLVEDTGLTKRKQKERDYAFRELVREAYDYTCAICGKSRQGPEGNPEVEAAHIYPKRLNGSDDPRNGICLCRLHHWAFDVGWLSLSNDHTIIVKDMPDHDQHLEFSDLGGSRILLPDDSNMHPHQKFLQKHREIHNLQ